jgi:hypothetical protein
VAALRRAPAFLLLLVLASEAQAARRVPADFASLQSALDASVAGDTVLVAPGTYAERVTLKAGVVLRAETVATLDAGHAGPAVFATGLSPAPKVEGFHLVNGSGRDLGGATLGGVLAVVGGALEASDCTFEGGQATYGGATGASSAQVTFRRCTWTGSSGSFGGGHFQSGGNVMIEDGAFEGTSAIAGGGVYLTGGARASVLTSRIHKTQSTGDGGGFRVDDCVLTLSEVMVDGANAGGRGGGLAIAAGAQVIASACVLVDCGSTLGGGLFHLSCAPALTTPGLAVAECAMLSMTHCDLMLGRGPAPAAGGVTDAAALHMESSLVAGNASGLACLDPRATLDVRCSDLYQNGGPDLSGSCVAAASGNLAVDPYLCDLAGRNFGLCANSPLLDPGCGSAPWGAGVLSCGGCGPTPSQTATWGRVKARYRQ